MEVEISDPKPEASGSGDKTESFTKEQVATLVEDQVKAATELLRKEYTGIQSGLQRKVKEAEEDAKRKELEGKTLEEQLMARVGALEDTNKQSASDLHHERMKAKGREILDEASIKPPVYFDRLIGNDEEETVKLVTDFVEEQKARDAERNMQYDRTHGRTVAGSQVDPPDSWAKLNDLTDEQLKSMDPREIARITREAGDRVIL